MATLHKKVDESVTTYPNMDEAEGGNTASPSTSDDRDESAGGVRLDTHLENLSLQDPRNPAAYEPPHHREGHVATSVTNQSHVGLTENTHVFQVGTAPEDEDVFGTSVKPTENYVSASNMTSMAAPSLMQSYHPEGPGYDPTRPVTQQPVRDTVEVQRSHQSDLANRHQTGGVDAQEFYPPSACVFVANLPEMKSDQALEVAITRVFSKFGTVFVKIRRDQKNMPFAFCQYTNNDDAKQAMLQGKGAMIEGRCCRTEMVKANRSYVIFSPDGREVDTEEARGLLAPFGPISRCERLNAEHQMTMDLPGAVLVEYARFDASRDVIAAFRHHAQYRVIAYDLKKASQPRIDPDEAWLQRYAIDRRSVYVGGLPIDVENLEELLSRYFSEAGAVENIQVIRKEARTEHGRPVVFAFVTFARTNMAELAVDQLHGTDFLGCLLRVERKSSRDAPSTRRVRSTFIPMTAERVSVSSRVGDQTNRFESQVPYGSGQANEAKPSTPLRMPGAEQMSVSRTGSVVPSASPMHVPYGYTTYSSPSYMASGYEMPPPSYGGQFGTRDFPATPQVTAGMTSPYSGQAYYTPGYAWQTPFIQDPFAASSMYVSSAAYGSPHIPLVSRDAVDRTVAGTPSNANGGNGEVQTGAEGGTVSEP